MIKASRLIVWIKSKVGYGYVYGTTGYICTMEVLKMLQTQYGTSMGNGYYQLNGDYTKGRCGKWLGKWTCDCSGLIKAARKTLSAVWQDVSAQGLYDQCTKRGTIKNMPLMPGCTVYIYNTAQGRMGHVGLYTGQGNVIEARGADYGIVSTRLIERAWTHWGLLPWLEYDIEIEKLYTGIHAAVVTKDAGDATNPKPDDKPTVQELVTFLNSTNPKIINDSVLWLKKATIDKDILNLMINMKNYIRKGLI